ncbi:MAG: EAL domain-containing protein [Steroidobacteraceae bacterium]
MADGRLVGIEALLRWETPRDGTRTPNEFIPAAETSGLIVDIGSWVVEAACQQLAIWREQGIAPSRLSINVSVQQLKYVEFPRNVRRILDKYGLPPELLEIELTESVLADEIAGAALRQLAEHGLRLALDDFGTGYSSLNYLRQHPIKVVKIDRSFLEDVPANPASATLAETIITMAHALGKEVVAEGVETIEQLMFLRERRCDLAQGYFLAKPMPVDEVSALLQNCVLRRSPWRGPAGGLTMRRASGCVGSRLARLVQLESLARPARPGTARARRLRRAQRLLKRCAILAATRCNSSRPHHRARRCRARPGPRHRGPAYLLALAEQQLGAPYRYGGASPGGFDCSGLVLYVHGLAGITVPRTAAGQQPRRGRSIAARCGRATCCSSPATGTQIDHVGIYAGDGRFVHAPRTGRPVAYDRLDDPWYAPRWRSAGRFRSAVALPPAGARAL